MVACLRQKVWDCYIAGLPFYNAKCCNPARQEMGMRVSGPDSHQIGMSDGSVLMNVLIRD
jgi:hypothetical protein